MDVAQIRTEVKRIFGDEAGVQVTDDDITRWINSGQRQIVSQNEGLLEKIGLTSTVTDQNEYTLPVDLLILRSISFKPTGDTAYRRLRGFNLNEFNEYIDGWDSTEAEGVPVCYSIFSEKIILYPTPTESITDSLKIYYNRKPTPVAGNPTDVPDLPELYHESLVQYCLMKAYEMDEDHEGAGAKGQQLNADMNVLRGRDDWKQQDTYPVITVLIDDA